MDPGVAFGVIASIVAVLGFLASQITAARSLTKAASGEWVGMLEKEVGFLKGKLDECEKDRERLHAQVDAADERERAAREREYHLLRRVETLEGERR